jgi:hypothetical protein
MRNEADAIKNPRKELGKSGALTLTKDTKDSLSNLPADVKSWPFNDQPIDSPAGILCTLKGIVASIFRAKHSDGGYDCYVSLGYGIFGGGGYTRKEWVGVNPPGGLSLTLVLRAKNHAFLAEIVLDREDVACRDQGKLVVSRKDIDPDLYDQTDYIMLWVNEASWYRC